MCQWNSYMIYLFSERTYVIKLHLDYFFSKPSTANIMTASTEEAGCLIADVVMPITKFIAFMASPIRVDIP